MRKLKLFATALIIGASLTMLNGVQAKAETFSGDVPDTNETAQRIELSTQYESQFETVDDKDFYQFTSSNSNSYYEFVVTNIDGKDDTVQMFIDDNEGKRVEYISAGEASTTKIIVRLEPGKTFYIHMMQDRRRATSKYTFSVNEIVDDYYESNSTAAEIQLGKSYECSFETSFDKDYFKFTTTENNSYYKFDLVNLTGKDWVKLEICREDNSQVELMTAGETSSIILKLDPGSVYYLHAYLYFGRGEEDYKFSITEVIDDHNDDILKATSIDLSKELDCTFETSYDKDYFQFKTTKNNSFYKIEIANQSQDERYVTTLYNEDYSSIEHFLVDQSNRGYQLYKLEPNKTYYLGANKYFEREGSSKYKLSVKEVKDDAYDTFEESSKLTLNKTSSYTLQAPQDVDFLSFKTNSGTTTYNISVKNSSNDRFNVHLYDADNILVGNMQVDKNSENSLKYTLKKNKTYYLKVSEGSEKANYKVTVNGGYIKVTSVELNKKSATLKKGETLKLTAEYKPGNATIQSITWTSSDKSIATVNSKTGIVSAKKAGVVNVTCSVKTKDGTVKKQVCKITVK